MIAQDFNDPLWGAIPYPAVLVDQDDKIVFANNATEVFGSTSLRQMQGKDLGRYVGAESTVVDMVQQARSGAVSIVQYNVEISWRERSVDVFTVHASQLQDQTGRVLLLFHPRGLAEQMDRSLTHRSAARSVTGMASMLAHEIRNPLAGIAGAAQLLSMNLGDSEQELTTVIQDEATRIGKLVERVEQFGDIRPAQRNEVNIHDVLDRARRAASAGFASHVKFREDYDPSLPSTVGDGDQLLQVFQNLFKNASEAVPKVGGYIQIKTGYRPGVKLSLPGGRSESLPLMVSVRDNGSGIPSNLISDIFDPFVSSKANGTGLGLALVSKIMADHGGVVECDSEPGRTIFTLRLPVWHAPRHQEDA
ncbi:MAG: ATP-binding protein [Pseudomonadota bacterium]